MKEKKESFKLLMRNQTNIKKKKMKNRKYQICNWENQGQHIDRNKINLLKIENKSIIFMKRQKINF